MNFTRYLQDNPHISVSQVLSNLEAPAMNTLGTDDIDAEIDLLYANGRDKGVSTGWPSLDAYYRIAPGFWTLVTGYPNMGKSSFVDNLAVNTMQKHGWRWLFFSAENRPYEAHWAGLAELVVGKPFDKEHPFRMNQDELAQAKVFLREHVRHVRIDDKQPPSVKQLLEAGMAEQDKYNISAMVIDPWNELEHSRPYGQNETEYVSAMLSAVRSMARSTGIHIFVVAHPAKRQGPQHDGLKAPTPHDVSGSAHFWNKSDYALCVHRDFTDRTGETFVHCQKARHRYVARLGTCSLYHDPNTNRYQDPLNMPRYQRQPGEE